MSGRNLDPKPRRACFILLRELGSGGLPPSSGPSLTLLQEGPRVHRDDGFRRGGTVSQGAVGPDGVVVAEPFLDQDLGFAEGVEELAVEEFIAETGIEASQ
jgi:hypothetical protein